MDNLINPTILSFDNSIKDSLACIEFLFKMAELNDVEINKILKNG